MTAAVRLAVWLALSLAALLLLQRSTQRRLQEILFLLVRRVNWALFLYALLLFPGVALHEASHWVVAQVLRVPTGRLSLWPRLQRNGMLRLGYVETARADFVRESTIGIAPLVSGVGLAVWIAGTALGLSGVGASVEAGLWREAASQLRSAFAQPLAPLWVYLAFAVSNAMMPSASDRHAWPWLALLGGALGLGVALVGQGPVLLRSLAVPLSYAARMLASAFSMTAALDAALLPPLWLAQAALARTLGYPRRPR